MNNPLLEMMTKKTDELKSIIETLKISVELIDTATDGFQMILDNVSTKRLEVEKEYKDILDIHNKTKALSIKVFEALETIARNAEQPL